MKDIVDIIVIIIHLRQTIWKIENDEELKQINFACEHVSTQGMIFPEWYSGVMKKMFLTVMRRWM